MKSVLTFALLGASMTNMTAAVHPEAEISNGHLHAKIYLPDAKRGFYRGTRFDWSGVVHSLTLQGHDYYGPWFDKTDPSVHDFVYRGTDIVAGPCSAITGPVDEFGPVGFDEAKPGGTFIKIGIGALRKPDAQPYDNYRVYEIADAGTWTVTRKADSIEFTQELTSAYVYRKTLQFTEGEPEMVLSHRLKNTGPSAIHTRVYNHNFLVWDGQAPGPGVVITVPFQIHSEHPPTNGLAEIRGDKIVYLKSLKDHDVVAMPIQGFEDSSKDHRIRIENGTIGMTIEGDRPLESESLWSICTVLAMEPFVSITVEPGGEFAWKTTYRYFVKDSK